MRELIKSHREAAVEKALNEGRKAALTSAVFTMAGSAHTLPGSGLIMEVVFAVESPAFVEAGSGEEALEEEERAENIIPRANAAYPWEISATFVSPLGTPNWIRPPPISFTLSLSATGFREERKATSISTPNVKEWTLASVEERESALVSPPSSPELPATLISFASVVS